MIKIYRIDKDGFYIFGNDGFMHEGDTPESDYVVDAPPLDYARARYVDGAWIDEGILPPEEAPKTLDERIHLAEESLRVMQQTIEELELRLQTLEGVE